MNEPREERRVTLVLGPEAKGRRLDRALADRLPEHSRTVLAGWIKDGRVEVEGRRGVARERLQGGERVALRIPPARPLTVEPEDVPLTILHEDRWLLVVDKPAGWTVHPGSGRKAGTLANALAHHVRGLPEATGSDRPGIVHRLDKDTSGALVVAKTEPVQRALCAAFAARRVKKTYLACVHGRPVDASGVIDAPIGRSQANRKKMAVRQSGGRAATTRWRRVRTLPRHTLLEVEPVTGRTHQIRVHLQSIGHPIVGDVLYGRRAAPGEAEAGRLLLHAFRLALTHPETGEAQTFEAPLPADFEEALERLARLEPPRRGG